MTTLIYEKSNWKSIEPSQNIIFVIVPGAGTFRNKEEYSRLGEKYKLVFLGKTGGIYDNYPDNWDNNINVSKEGRHLGGIAGLIEQYIHTKKIIPSAIICGSRGGQVTIGKVWETVWRGPTIIINASCLTTNTKIPQGVLPLFISMENDYFKRVNSLDKVIKLFYRLIETTNQKGIFIHLKNEYHMPNFNKSILKNMLTKCIDYLLHKKEFGNELEDVIIKRNY